MSDVINMLDSSLEIVTSYLSKHFLISMLLYDRSQIVAQSIVYFIISKETS